MFCFLTAVALATPTATPQEETALLTGAPVIRALPPPSPTAVKVIGMVDVRASEDEVWKVLMDFPGRLPTNPSLTSLVPYRTATPTEQWWAFTVQKFGMTMVYHNHYVRAPARLTHELDSTQKNDIASNNGTYEVGPCTSAAFATCSRLYWTVETDFGRALPGMIKTWLGKSAG